MVKNVVLIRGILIGLILLLGGWYLAGSFGDHSLSADSAEDSLSVVIANRYIAAFTPVALAQVTVRNFPKGYIPPGALHATNDLMAENGLPLFASAVAIPEGQPVTRTVLIDLGKSHGMASILGPGKVAVSFSVDPVRGAGGWVQPGDTIAIFNSRREGDFRKIGSRTSSLLFPAVRVLAVDHRRVGNTATESSTSPSGNDAEAGGNVLTVLMNPLEATRLVEERENGRLSVVLRALGDDLPWVNFTGARHE